MCTAFEEMNIESILAVMNTTELVVEIRRHLFPVEREHVFVTTPNDGRYAYYRSSNRGTVVSVYG